MHHTGLVVDHLVRHTDLVVDHLVRHTDLVVVHLVVRDGPGHRGMEFPEENRALPGSIFR